MVMSMSENTIQYNNLKKKVISKSGDSIDIQKVKKYFSCIVDSRRSVSRIKSLNDLFCILEERDALDSNNVSTLLYLGKLLSNEDIINEVCGYKKLYIEDDDYICICGGDRAFTINNEKEFDNLETTMHNIAMNIGKNWRVLSSELKVPECYVDEIREKYPSDMYQQALKMLQVWKKYNKDKATVDVLKCALEARLCKMKGISIHMLKPVIVVN